MATTYNTTTEQRKVITDYAELVSLAYIETIERADSNIATIVADKVAQMLVPAVMQEYAAVLAAKPRIQMGPSTLVKH